MKKKKYLKICPKCGSTNVSTYTKAGVMAEELLDYCKDCYYGYQGVEGGSFFPEVEESKIEEFRKELKKKKIKSSP